MKLKDKNIYLGDIHGRFSVIENYLIENDINDCNIIQVGDFGLGFSDQQYESEQLSIINDRLKKDNNFLYAIRGNHDQKERFYDFYNFSNIYFVKDYEVINLKGENHLFIGGAISIDRTYRTEGKTYWKDEIFVLDEEKLENIVDIDVVVTHTAPDFCEPRNYNNSFPEVVLQFTYRDKNLLNDLNSERANMTRAFNKIKENNNIKWWVYGHFHKNYLEEIDGVNFRVIGINDFIIL